jgi:ABC-type lipoprotein export system ATPase subunit
MEILSLAAHKRGCTVLVVAHDPRVMPFADRTLHLEDGALKDGEGVIENPPAKGLHSRPGRGEEVVHL